MENKEIFVLIGLGLVVILILSFGVITGNVINESEIVGECNPADFNRDGIVNANDKMNFGIQYALDYTSEESCRVTDLNEDGKINFLDNNEFNRIYLINSMKNTGPCILKSPCAEEAEIIKSPEDLEESEVVEIIGELPSEKIGVFQRIKDFFKGLVGK